MEHNLAISAPAVAGLTRFGLARARLDHPRTRRQVQVLDDSTDDTAPRPGRLARRPRLPGVVVATPGPVVASRISGAPW